MDVSVQCANPVKEGLIGSCEWGQLWGNGKQGSSKGGSLVTKLGIALEDALVLLSITAPPLERCKLGCLEHDKESEKLTVTEDGSMTIASEVEVDGSVRLQCSRNALLCGVPLNQQNEISNRVQDGKNLLESDGNCSNSIKILPTLKLVSAMKGSRERRGLHVEKLSVSWAPDVYDPPVTSQSHTITSHNQYYSMMSKKSYRNKHKHKAKSSQSGSMKKKQPKNHRSSSKNH